MKNYWQIVITAGCMMLLTGTSLAAPPALPSSDAYRGFESGDMMLRLRGLVVDPETSSSTSIGGHVDGSTSAVPEVDFTYFFTPHIAAELIAATTPHHMIAKGTTSGTVDLGNVWLLPPTLTLQYHFLPDSPINPYLGAGVNYTFFYNPDPANGSVVTKIHYGNGFGAALQAGVDVHIQDNWYANFDIKHIFLNTDVSLNGGAITADVNVDPTIFGLGVGYRF